MQSVIRGARFYREAASICLKDANRKARRKEFIENACVIGVLSLIVGVLYSVSIYLVAFAVVNWLN